jgi:hypothetical protein
MKQTLGELAMATLIRYVGSVVLAGVAAFCAYGFLAATEVPDSVGSTRLLYGTVGIASACLAGYLARAKRQEG